MTRLHLLLLLLLAASVGRAEQTPTPPRYTVSLNAEGVLLVTSDGTGEWHFQPEFTVLVAAGDPKLAMRPAGIPRVPYNVPTWSATGGAGTSALGNVERSSAQSGDGFDDRILGGDTQSRTADVFAAAPVETMRAIRWESTGNAIHYTFADHPAFTLRAAVTLPTSGAATEPALAFTLTPKIEAWFSVGFTGAPALAVDSADEFWQPFLWQEKRFPAQSFLTPGFECPVPATFVRRGDAVLGVVVDADEFPFDPLPLLENSRFGVALRNRTGAAQPMVFAPVLGGAESHRTAGQEFTFRLRLYTGKGDATAAFEDVARRLYSFRDYRSNAVGTLNETLDNMIDYGMSAHSWFNDELKGCAYSTDVPGAVKNVSALNPLAMALVTDNEAIFRQRAYPIAEYLLSREKFLFSLDPEQKIQSPSRALTGPAAPLSELAALHGITRGASPVFRQLAERMLTRNRTLNLDEVSVGASWPNYLQLYLVTGDKSHLAQARAGADAHLAGRVANGARDLDEPGLFFWTAFTPKWIDLLELFEATGERRYLEAARQGARLFTMFTWVSPRIPDETVTVNHGGNAPHYWYLKSKGHAPMPAAEEAVPAWRLSEIGLTPESSGTMSGHRAIFMANHAPWMLRIAALTGDKLLHDVARSAVIGRYRNFPGYHINTARTTVYEQADYPLRPHLELSVNSFHYNHIWPHMSLLLDYLVTDASARSGGRIQFPSRYIEGYAYLQGRFYGDRSGRFHGYDDAILWMPQRLLQTGSQELNYIAARGDGRFYLAFANQSREPVATEVSFNADVFPASAQGTYRVRLLAAGQPDREVMLHGGRFSVEVDAMSQTAVIIEGLSVTPRFQQVVLGANAGHAWRQDYAELNFCNARAMILNFGAAARTAYVYLQADDSAVREVSLTYTENGRRNAMTDNSYPYEFTVPLAPDSTEFRFELSGLDVDGRALPAAEGILRQ